MSSKLYLYLGLIFLLKISYLPIFSQTIVYGFDHKFAPYEFLDKNKQPTGYNIDIMKAVGAEMGVKIQFLPGVWNDVKYKLEKTNEVDVLSMFYTLERDSLLDFTIPFNIVYHSIFRRTDEFEHIKTLNDLEGLRVAAQRGTIFIEQIRQIQLNIELIELAEDADAIHMLSEGKCDVIVVAHVPAVKYIEEQEIDNLVEAGEPVFPGHYSLAVKEGNELLLRNLNIAIANLKIKGVFAKVEQKWFPKHYSIFNARYFIVFLSLSAFIFLAFLIWNRALYSSVRKKTLQLENSNLKLRKISELNSKLLAADPNLHAYLDELRALFNADFCCITSAGSTANFSIFSGNDLRAIDKNNIRQQIFDTIAQSLQPVLIPDWKAYHSSNNGQTDSLMQGSYCAFAMVCENNLRNIFEIWILNKTFWFETSDIVYLQIVSLNLSAFAEKENLTTENKKQRVAILKEVEDRLISEEKLHESQERYGAIFETAEDAIIITTIEGKHLFRNNAFYASMGFTVEDAEIIANWSEVHPDDINVLMNEIPILQHRGTLTTEYRVKHRNGNWIYRSAKSTLIHDAKGAAYEALVIIRDVTDRKRSEQQLLESEKMLNKVGYIAKIGGWRTDKELNKTTWTKEIYNILELLEPERSLSISKLFSLINQGYIENVTELFDSLLVGNKLEGNVKFILTTELGNTIWCELVGNVEYENGRIAGLFGTLQNINNQQLLEQSLVKYKTNLEELVEQRTKELEDSVAELSRLNNLFVGREFRIKELRIEIESLKEKLKCYE